MKLNTILLILWSLPAVFMAATALYLFSQGHNKISFNGNNIGAYIPIFYLVLAGITFLVGLGCYFLSKKTIVASTIYVLIASAIIISFLTGESPIFYKHLVMPIYFLIIGICTTVFLIKGQSHGA